MGIDTQLWLLVRGEGIQPRPDPTAAESPAEHLWSTLRSAAGGVWLADTYWKNASPEDVADILDPRIRSSLRSHRDRAVLLFSVDEALGAIAWGVDPWERPAVVRRSDHDFDGDALRPCFIPEEPASLIWAMAPGGADGSLRLAKALDRAFADALRRCVAGGETCFRAEPTPGLHGASVAIHKLLLGSGGGPAVVAYHTPIEGSFAFVCGLDGSPWPLHVRLPFSLDFAPGALAC